tara:strand:- start:278 stop:763 length:486 start_codon:yes stop_codon:yes gene_type:complete
MGRHIWTHNNKLITAIDDMPENTYGFIYEVTHIPTSRKYIGKKVLYFERNKRLGVKALAALREERKAKGIGGRTPLKQKVITESDWKTYYGSQKEILELVKNGNKEEFKREILQYVSTKKQLTYFECKHLFIKEVLENRNNYINDNILGKFYRKDFFNDKD